MKIEDSRDRPPYCVLWHDELCSPEVLALPPLALRVWILLQMYVGKGGWCLGQERLADELGAKRKSVNRSMQRLKTAGLIEWDHTVTADGDPGWCRYRLLRPPSLTPQLVIFPTPADEGGGVPPAGGRGVPPAGGMDASTWRQGRLQVEALPQTPSMHGPKFRTLPPTPSDPDAVTDGGLLTESEAVVQSGSAPLTGDGLLKKEVARIMTELGNPFATRDPDSLTGADALWLVEHYERTYKRRWTGPRRKRDLLGAVLAALPFMPPPAPKGTADEHADRVEGTCGGCGSAGLFRWPSCPEVTFCDCGWLEDTSGNVADLHEKRPSSATRDALSVQNC